MLPPNRRIHDRNGSLFRLSLVVWCDNAYGLDFMNLATPDFEDMHRQRIKGFVGSIDRLTPRIIKYSKLFFLHRVTKVGKGERQPNLFTGDLDSATGNLGGVFGRLHVGLAPAIDHSQEPDRPLDCAGKVGSAQRTAGRRGARRILVTIAIIGKGRKRTVVQIHRVVIRLGNVNQPAARVGIFIGYFHRDGRTNLVQYRRELAAARDGNQVFGFDDHAVSQLQPEANLRRFPCGAA